MAEQVWTTLGLVAQACFFMRFVVQWIASERRQESVVPVAFWYWSLVGAVGLLVYSIHLGNPVFILGNSTGFFIYIRNLVMIRKAT